MYPAQFDYHRPASVDEAIKLLADNEDAKILAGGHSLLPAMKLRLAAPATLIDVGRLDELKGINANGNLEIGALATHAQIASSADVKSYCPPLATATGLVGDPQVRNFGTLGGNLAHADPAADPPTVVLACDGVIHVKGSGGKRSVNASDFFIDLFTVDLKPDEIVTRIDLPNLSDKKSAYVKMVHPASRYAIVGVCVVLDMDGSSCTGASVAVGGATPKVVRSADAEGALVGSAIDDTTLNAAADALMSGLGDDLMDDVSYPADYRRMMAGVHFKRAVKAALA